MDYHISTAWGIGILVLVLWELVWKGIGLWRAAQNNQIGWYLAILIFNTAGILPIIYILISQGEHNDKHSHE